MNRFEMNEGVLLNYLDSRGFKYRRSGKEILLEECPYCKSRDKKFSFNCETTEFHCFKGKCEVKGNLLTFMRDHGEDPLPKKKAYTLPNQAKALSLAPVDTEGKDTATRFYRWYSGRTGISVKILKQYQIGFLASRDKENKAKTYITFPFYKDGQIIDIKYRNVDVKPDMFTEKAAEKNFFGLQFVNFDKDELLITEGEKDCMALVDYGFENVVSVPNGARNFSEPMMETLRRGKFKRLYLFFDNDEAGQGGAQDFAKRVGSWRCRNVRLPYKDAQDCLRQHVEEQTIRELMASAKKFDIEDSLENDVLISPDEQLERFVADSRKNQYGIQFKYPLLDQITGGLFPGQLLGILGGPGGFKTTLAQNLLHHGAADLAEGEFAAFFTMDMTGVREFQRRLQIDTGASRSLLRRGAAGGEDDFLRMTTAYVTKHPNIYTSDRSNVTVPQMVQMIRNTEYMTGKRCRLVAIDYLDYIEQEDAKAFNPIGDIMNALNKKMAKPLELSVIILVQSNRPNLAAGGQYGGMGLGDGKGGRSIEQELDFYIGLYKDPETGEQRGNFLKHREYEPNKALIPGIYPFPYFRLRANGLKVVDLDLIPEEVLAAEKEARKKKKQPKDKETTW